MVGLWRGRLHLHRPASGHDGTATRSGMLLPDVRRRETCLGDDRRQHDHDELCGDLTQEWAFHGGLFAGGRVGGVKEMLQSKNERAG